MSARCNCNETNRHWLDAVIDPDAHRESDLLAFEIVIERSQPGAVVAAYNKVNGDYPAGNDHLLNDVPGEMSSQAVEQFGLRQWRRLRRCQRKHDDFGGVDGSGSHQQPTACDDGDPGPDRIAPPALRHRGNRCRPA